MHELSVAQSLVELAAAHARRAGANRVTRIRCRIGTLRQIEDDLIRDAFECARQGTLCREAELVVERTLLRAECDDCGRVFDVKDWRWTCPDCGTDARSLPGGDELELTSIDVER